MHMSHIPRASPEKIRRRRRRRRRVARKKRRQRAAEKRDFFCRETLLCLYLTRARSNPTPDPRTPGPPPVARVRVCSDVRTSALATLGGARGSLKKSSARATPKNLFVGAPASRRPTHRPPPVLKTPGAHFLSSRCRVCLRRDGVYFMSSRRSEVLRRFCGRASDERGGFGGRRQFRVFFSFSSPGKRTGASSSSSSSPSNASSSSSRDSRADV